MTAYNPAFFLIEPYFFLQWWTFCCSSASLSSWPEQQPCLIWCSGNWWYPIVSSIFVLVIHDFPPLFCSNKYFPELTDNVPSLNYFVTPVVAIVIGTYFITSSFFGVYEMAVDTLFLCFLEGKETLAPNRKAIL